MIEKRVGLLGGTSFVGERLYPVLQNKNYQVSVFSRRGGEGTISLTGDAMHVKCEIRNWICLAPIWTIPDNFGLLEKYGARRLVALSSTSRFSKIASHSAADRELAKKLIEGEENVQRWAHSADCDVIILHPTLIYGLGKDQNISEIARFIQRFGFFPILGRAEGLRQPVHVDDVAIACCSALELHDIKKDSYVLSGGEVLTYRAMVERIFMALGRKPRFVRCPLSLFSFAIRLANLLPPFKELTTEMARRMNKNLNFNNADAKADLGFTPRPFSPHSSDVTTRE